MNAYIVARAYLLALIAGGVAFLSLLMATGISRGNDPMIDWMVGAFGFVATFLVFGAIISPLAFLCVKIIRKNRWVRPLADALWGALLVVLVLLVIPPFEISAAFGEWGRLAVLLEGACIGSCMGVCYWFLAGKPGAALRSEVPSSSQ